MQQRRPRTPTPQRVRSARKVPRCWQAVPKAQRIQVHPCFPPALRQQKTP
nr:MAG TPA: hypothetical protein [Caudoviricetes sp.]